MTNPLLSICIATYNRAGYIGETLESIIPQVTEEVEVVIVDGASTDHTSTVVKRYADKCQQMRYIRLPLKGGVDQDYSKAVELAQGEMCWLFPDDDLLKPDAIKTVLKEVKKNFSLVVVNAQLMNKDLSKTIADRILQINMDEIYAISELNQLFQRVITYMSFIGCVVINRDLWLQREKARYFGTEFIHVGVIFQSPLPSPALVIAEPYIAIRYGNAQWTNRAFEIGMIKWPKLLYSFEHISKQVRQEHSLSKPWRKLQRIIIYRSKGEYSLTEYQKWFASKDSPLWWRIAAFLIALTPSGILNFVMLSFLKRARKDKSITIYDLENNKHNICRLFCSKNLS